MTPTPRDPQSITWDDVLADDLSWVNELADGYALEHDQDDEQNLPPEQEVPD